MSNLYGRTEEVFSRSYDKGHFICHGAGGGCDWNLFPQLRSLNRGWTDEGKLYSPHGARRLPTGSRMRGAADFDGPHSLALRFRTHRLLARGGLSPYCRAATPSPSAMPFHHSPGTRWTANRPAAPPPCPHEHRS